MPDLTLDHVVIAVRDLDAATADYTALLGRKPSWRGEHPKYGTRNTLFRIDNTYVELLAPRRQGRRRRWAGELPQLPRHDGEGLYALALGTIGIDDAVKRPARRRARGRTIPPTADGVDADHRRAPRLAQRAWCTPKSTNGARIFFIEHHSPPDALPVAPCSTPRTARTSSAWTTPSCCRPTWRRRGGCGATCSARASRSTARSRSATRASSSSASPTSRRDQRRRAADARRASASPTACGASPGASTISTATCARLTRRRHRSRPARARASSPARSSRRSRGTHTHGVATLLIEHTPESFRAGVARCRTAPPYDNAPQTARVHRDRPRPRRRLSTTDLDATARHVVATLGLRAR